MNQNNTTFYNPLPGNKLKIVFIAGGFDGCHEGHINILKRAKELGDVLIVAINNDEYFKKKGPNRPINNQLKRMNALLKTGLPDHVEIFEGSPIDNIMFWKPDFIVTGDDYKENQIVGFEESKTWGGKVIIFPRTPGISTTEMLNKSYNERY